MVFERSQTDLVLVLTSEVNSIVATALAKELLNKRLAVCVTLREIQSYFWWDEKLQEDNEVQLLIKTTNHQLQKLLDVVNQLHTYKTPELLYWKVSTSHEYGQWAQNIVASTSK